MYYFSEKLKGNILQILTKKISLITINFGKNKSREKITLVKNEETKPDDVEVANILNNYFSNVVKNLKIQENILTVSLP